MQWHRGLPRWPQGQGCVAFLPLTLRAEKPKQDQYPREIVTLGDHLRATRLDRKLLQRDVAHLLGVDTSTVDYWELNRAYPRPNVLPGIMSFLGYCPYEPAPNWGMRLRVIRHKFLGWSHEKMARAIGIDRSTLTRIERDDSRVSRRVRDKVNRYLDQLAKLAPLTTSKS